MILKKFLRIGTYELARQKAYHFDLLIWMIVIPMFFVVEYAIWRAVFSSGGVELVRGFTLSQLLTYYLMTHITLLFTNSNIDVKIAEKVKSGSLIKNIIKPMHFFWLSFAQHAWIRIFNLVMLAPILILVGALLIPELTATLATAFWYSVSVILAVILTFMYVFLFGITSFWVKDYLGVRVIRRGVGNFLAGAIIPLSFFPASFQHVFSFLPFQYMLFVPIQIFLGKYPTSQLIVLLGTQLVWICVFGTLCFLAWRKAKTKFMGVGI